MAKRRLPTGIFRPKNNKGWVSPVHHIRLTLEENKRASFEAYADLELTLRLRTDLIRQLEYHRAGEPLDRTKIESNKLLKQHLIRLGVYQEVTQWSIDESLAQYKLFLSTSDNGEAYVRHTVGRIRRLATACCWTRPQDIEAGKFLLWLKEQRDADKFGKKTSNHYIGSLHTYVRWLMLPAIKQLTSDPLAAVQLLTTEDDVRRERRALTAEEHARLIEATAGNKNKRRLSADARIMVYRVAYHCGLRANEIASLTPSSFQLDTTPPTVSVKATISKRRKLDVVPLFSELANDLRTYLEGKPATERLWPGKWYRRAAEMLADDLAAASIAEVDPQGRVIDFHGLRHSFVTALALSGVAPKTAQTLARHSTITLTMGAYSHIERQPQAEAIEQAFGKGPRTNGRTKKKPKSR